MLDSLLKKPPSPLLIQPVIYPPFGTILHAFFNDTIFELIRFQPTIFHPTVRQVILFRKKDEVYIMIEPRVMNPQQTPPTQEQTPPTKDALLDGTSHWNILFTPHAIETIKTITKDRTLTISIGSETSLHINWEKKSSCRLDNVIPSKHSTSSH